MHKYITTAYSIAQLKSSAMSFSSNNHANGTWRINGKNAMDKDGRIFLSFIKNSTYRELNYLRGLLKRGFKGEDGKRIKTGFHNLNRPFRMDRAMPFKPANTDDAFASLANCGEVWALQRLITRTDIVKPRRAAILMAQAEKVKYAIDKKPFKPSKSKLDKA